MPTLVLVHIGSHFPEYVNYCIRKAKSVSRIDIHLLISRVHFNKIEDSVSLFALEDIIPSSKRKQFEARSKLDSKGMDGFWKYATMRFFFLYEHILSNNLTDVFHIENDNLIYLDFLDKLEQFQEKQMWCVMDSTTRCIPSFLYFKDSNIIARLLDTCIAHSSRGSNDMFALGEFRNNNSDVGVLPICGTYADPIDLMFYENASKFNCIFDAAAVGQYIGGVDPRNGSANTIGFINETSPVKCNRARVEWIDKKPYLNGLPLVNLHIHSKDLKRWI
jgi:hypothetical protein